MSICRSSRWAGIGAEQLAIVAAVAADVQRGDDLRIDVTHGFRHVPMLAAAAAGFVARSRRATVRAIYYGALEMTRAGEAAPVVEIPVLGELEAWGAGLAQLQSTGDPGDLAEACRTVPQLSKDLAAASYALRSGQYERTIEASRGASKQLRGLRKPRDPLLALAASDLEQVLLPDDGKSEPAQLVELARRIGARDPMRVLSLLREAVVLVGWRDGLKEDGTPYQNKASTEGAWGAATRIAARAGVDKHSLANLRELRNAVVHGLLPGGPRVGPWVREAIKNPRKLSAAIDKLTSDVELMV